MPIPTRLVLLTGLLLAAACSDAGTPVAAGDHDSTLPEPASVVLQAVICTVDEVARRASCAPASAQLGNALGVIAIGSSLYAQLVTSNNVSTADSSIFDVAIQNLMNGQAIGTTDGVTAHSYGMRVYFYSSAQPQPRVLTKTNPADTAWISVVTPDSQVFAGAGSKMRPYFKYAPEVVHPQDTSASTTWKFALHNVATWSFVVYISTEVQFPRGWLDVTPATPSLLVGNSTTLTAAVRNAFGGVFRENLNWSSSNPAVVSVAEAPVDSLAQITGVSQGTAWVKAGSASPNSLEALARRDSVLVTVNSTGPITWPF